MKTHIVRRVDELGRVAIPREIRRSLQICEGDFMEIYLEEVDGMPVISFVKYDNSTEEDNKKG